MKNSKIFFKNFNFLDLDDFEDVSGSEEAYDSEDDFGRPPPSSDQDSPRMEPVSRREQPPPPSDRSKKYNRGGTATDTTPAYKHPKKTFNTPYSQKDNALSRGTEPRLHLKSKDISAIKRRDDLMSERDSILDIYNEEQKDDLELKNRMKKSLNDKTQAKLKKNQSDLKDQLTKEVLLDKEIEELKKKLNKVESKIDVEKRHISNKILKKKNRGRLTKESIELLKKQDMEIKRYKEAYNNLLKAWQKGCIDGDFGGGKGKTRTAPRIKYSSINLGVKNKAIRLPREVRDGTAATEPPGNGSFVSNPLSSSFRNIAPNSYVDRYLIKMGHLNSPEKNDMTQSGYGSVLGGPGGGRQAPPPQNGLSQATPAKRGYGLLGGRRGFSQPRLKPADPRNNRMAPPFGDLVNSALGGSGLGQNNFPQRGPRRGFGGSIPRAQVIVPPSSSDVKPSHISRGIIKNDLEKFRKGLGQGSQLAKGIRESYHTDRKKNR